MKSRLPHRPARPAARRPALLTGTSSRGFPQGGGGGTEIENRSRDDLGLEALRCSEACRSIRSRAHAGGWSGRTEDGEAGCGRRDRFGRLPVGDRRSGRWQGGFPVGPVRPNGRLRAWQHLGSLNVGSRRARPAAPAPRARTPRPARSGRLPPAAGVHQAHRSRCAAPRREGLPEPSRAGSPKGFPRRQARIPSDGMQSVGSRSSAPDASLFLRSLFLRKTFFAQDRFTPSTHAQARPRPASRPTPRRRCARARRPRRRRRSPPSRRC